MRRFRAVFSPEAWIRNYAEPVDPLGEDTWDCTAFLMAEELLPEVERAMDEAGEWKDDADRLKEDPAAPQWVKDWRGPFTITVREQ